MPATVAANSTGCVARAAGGRARTLSVIVALAPGLVACAHGARRLPPELVETAYAQARTPGAACPTGEPPCCTAKAGAARAAAAGGDLVGAAHLWQEVALTCPGRRDEAAAALATPRPAPAAPPARLLNVSYRTRLPPAFRLYWVATAVGRRLLPSAGLAAAAHPVHVEVHAIRFDGNRPGPLLVAERRFDLSFEEGATVTVEIGEGDAAGGAPLRIHTQVERVPVPRSRSARPRARADAAAPRLEKARPLRLDPPRAPLELAGLLRAARPTLRVCLDREGQLETVRFLDPAHPRLAASLIDMFRDARHEPYRVNDLAVPSCDLVKPS